MYLFVGCSRRTTRHLREAGGGVSYLSRFVKLETSWSHQGRDPREEAPISSSTICIVLSTDSTERQWATAVHRSILSRAISFHRIAPHIRLMLHHELSNTAFSTVRCEWFFSVFFMTGDNRGRFTEFAPHTSNRTSSHREKKVYSGPFMWFQKNNYKGVREIMIISHRPISLRLSKYFTKTRPISLRLSSGLMRDNKTIDSTLCRRDSTQLLIAMYRLLQMECVDSRLLIKTAH